MHPPAYAPETITFNIRISPNNSHPMATYFTVMTVPVIIMLLSGYYLFTLQPEKLSQVTPSVYFRRVVSVRRRANWYQSSCFRPRWS